jgi:phosphoglucosamine mutase
MAMRLVKQGEKSAEAPARKLFGTDGVRGVANVHPMTSEMALRLGRALAYLVRSGPHRHRIVIGKDTRLSGYMLEHALASGIESMGVDVYFTGPLPTPAIAFITQSMRADAGAVISASHNPYQDNGIKFFSRDGFKLPDEMEARIEELVHEQHIDHLRPTEDKIGKAFKIDDAGGRYVVHAKSIFPRAMTLDGLTIVVDCGHGAAYRVAPSVFEELGAKVVRLGDKPDGKNINAKCGALHPEAMCKAVVRHKADLGIALDGDADRLIVADEKGRVVDGDRIMAVCARDLIARKLLPKKTLVATVMSNLGLERSLAEVGGKVVRTQVGDRHVVAEMRRGGYSFGGEQSGHLVFLEHATTGDGTIAALNLLAVLRASARPMSELAGVMEIFPQTQVNLVVTSKPELSTLAGVTKAVRSAEAALGAEGRVLVRYSGTEAKVRVLVEGPDDARNRRHADAIVDELRKAIG